MLDLLRYLLARLDEASTWTAIGGLAAAAHFQLPADWSNITNLGMGVAFGLGIIIQEAGTKTPSQVALDFLQQAANRLPSGGAKP